MVFGKYSRSPDYQSCVDLSRPDYLVFSYTKLVMAGLALMPEPESILIIGLGGGTLPTSLEALYPESQIDTVEIDVAVVRVAKQWFNYRESKTQKVHTVDGRVFIKRKVRSQQHYDLIILDAFNGDYIPEHLMTREFLQEAKQLLSKDGVLIANTFSNYKLYHHESVTYQDVFGPFGYIHSKKSGNRIIYAANNYERFKNPQQMAPNLLNRLRTIGVDLKEFNQSLTNKPDWDEDARPLTDQFSPANLLNQ